ncbi:MAG: hypothetical protein P1Q69_18995 [Candidatus Thorarchaeota archaeon]|nr:hypothetical protein [Candidatus Thorarchaeota archaeon]
MAGLVEVTGCHRSGPLTSKATYFRMKEEHLTRNECIGLFTRMTDGDLYRWLETSEIPFVREYASRIRYRRLYKVVLSRPIASFGESLQEHFLHLIENIESLVETELDVIDEPGKVIIDVVNPVLGEEFLSQIPILVGGETGFDLVRLNKTEEGRPLRNVLMQQKRTIPSVRVYTDPEHAETVRKRFEKLFPSEEQKPHRDDEVDFDEF